MSKQTIKLILEAIPRATIMTIGCVVFSTILLLAFAPEMLENPFLYGYLGGVAIAFILGIICNYDRENSI